MRDALIRSVRVFGAGVWDLLCNVRFAVLQIALLCVAGIVGTLVEQLPGYALHDLQAYALEMDRLRARYETVELMGLKIGPFLTDSFETLGFFRVFGAPWFLSMLTLLTLSIAVCTLNRVPNLWREARRVRVAQPAAFFDPQLSNREWIERGGIEVPAVIEALRKNRFRQRLIAHENEAVLVYASKNQYAKLATLLTHAGLILFLAAGAVTSAFGFETVVFLGDNQTAPVQPVGTPRNLLVRNIEFGAPQRPDGTFADFWTDLVVYREGQQVARKTIRVNDPLEFEGFYFHQNTFGPAQQMEIRDVAGALLWSGPVLLTGQTAGLPQAFLTIPGSQVGLMIVLDRQPDGAPSLAMVGLSPSGEPGSNNLLFATQLAVGERTDPALTSGFSIKWLSAGAYTGMVIKRDPGAPFVWTGFGALIIGLLVTFYFPRRRVWLRLTHNGAQVAFMADRYVAADKELEALVDALKVATDGPVARRGLDLARRLRGARL